VQQGILLGVHHRSQKRHPNEAAELLPDTQGPASTLIKSRNSEELAAI
jgi:hypothetical protein